MTPSDYETIVGYHEATKHHFHRYARSAGVMDWANQPNPFRYYEGVEKILLPFRKNDPVMAYDALYSPLAEAGQSLSAESLSSFLAFSMGLSAWKKAGGGQWALRINPSSGNLHPTEAHLIIPFAPGLKSGVFHYFSFEHALEQRADLPEGVWPLMASHFGGPGFIVALSTIFWRESWKYGERAYRYCNLDAGHALAALSIAARLLNWELTCLTGAGDEQIRTMLGIDQTPWHPLEEEVPELVCWISVNAPAGDVPQGLPQELVLPFGEHTFSGNPNPLSRKPVDWAIISKASTAAEKTETIPEADFLDPKSGSSFESKQTQATHIIRQRRSAVKYNPQEEISLEAFQSILNHTLARQGIVPFSTRLMPPSVHLLLFVHRVADLAPGLYLLVRRPEHVEEMRLRWRKDFLWQRLWPDLPLYRIRSMDATMDAMELSCHQEIAGESAFAVAMISRFEDILSQAPYKYRHLHWECGMIGQVLYLEAEAHGIRGTGIGCFFDDPVHHLLGVKDHTYQSLYHFTVGHPIEDTRLQTLAAYHHLDLSGR
jgi:SagB-type dehydrogenase family enzyme